MPDRTELLYDHYKDTFEQIKLNITKREQYFIFATLLLFASIFSTFNPSYVQDVSNTLSKEKLGIDLDLAFYTINSLFVFLSLWYLIRYYQSVLIIENLYSYIHKVESKLCLLIKDYEISREGEFYLKSYPILKSCIHSFYFIIFPFLVIIASLIKIYWELFEISTIPIISLVFDVFFLIAIVLLTVLYLSWIHFRDFKKSKKNEDKKNGL